MLEDEERESWIGSVKAEKQMQESNEMLMSRLFSNRKAQLKLFHVTEIVFVSCSLMQQFVDK